MDRTFQTCLTRSTGSAVSSLGQTSSQLRRNRTGTSIVWSTVGSAMSSRATERGINVDTSSISAAHTYTKPEEEQSSFYDGKDARSVTYGSVNTTLIGAERLSCLSGAYPKDQAQSAGVEPTACGGHFLRWKPYFPKLYYRIQPSSRIDRKGIDQMFRYEPGSGYRKRGSYQMINKPPDAILDNAIGDGAGKTQFSSSGPPFKKRSKENHFMRWIVTANGPHTTSTDFSNALHAGWIR